LGTFAYRSDILKPNISERLITTSVNSLTGEPDLQHVRRSIGIAPLLLQVPKAFLPLGLTPAALFDAWAFLLAPCIRCQTRLEFGTALVEGHGMSVDPNAAILYGEWEPIGEQTDGVYAVPENGQDDEWE